VDVHQPKNVIEFRCDFNDLAIIHRFWPISADF